MLLPGQGDSTKEKPVPQQETGEETLRAFSDEELKERGYVRVHDVEAGAGPERQPILEEVNGGEIMPAWYIRQEYGVAPWRIIRARVVGDSMTPELRPGDRVYCARIEGHDLRDGAIYLIRGPHGLQMKRLIFDREESDGSTGGDADRIWIWSDNEDRPRLRLTLEQFDRDYDVLAVALKKDLYL